MKITIVAAISKDGFLTKGSNPNPGDWTSDEDKAFYKSLLEKNNLYLMGCKTFSATKNMPYTHAQRIVMCHNVDDQPKIPGVYYSDESFEDIIAHFSGSHSQLLVLGGASIYHQMLEQNLINEAFVTVEPVINHTGVLFYNSKNYFENFGFELVSEKTLNTRGTVLKHYVLKK